MKRVRGSAYLDVAIRVRIAEFPGLSRTIIGSISNIDRECRVEEIKITANQEMYFSQLHYVPRLNGGGAEEGGRAGAARRELRVRSTFDSRLIHFDWETKYALETDNECNVQNYRVRIRLRTGSFPPSLRELPTKRKSRWPLLFAANQTCAAIFRPRHVNTDSMGKLSWKLSRLSLANRTRKRLYRRPYVSKVSR